MKKGIHPTYRLTKATCACGNEFETASTVENIRVEVCSACHPFFTGKQKLVDSAGRVERFQRKYAGLAPKPSPKRKKGAAEQKPEPEAQA